MGIGNDPDVMGDGESGISHFDNRAGYRFYLDTGFR